MSSSCARIDVTGVEHMAGGLDAAANNRRTIGRWRELHGQLGELGRRIGRAPGPRQACCAVESRSDRCVGAFAQPGRGALLAPPGSSR